MSIFKRILSAVHNGVIIPTEASKISHTAEYTPRTVNTAIPEFIYLGHKEFHELAKDPEAQMPIQISEGETNIYSTRILRVDAESHFSVGWAR